MLETLSLAATTAQLVTDCLTVSRYITSFIQNAHATDLTIQSLGVEVDSLSQVLDAINKSFADTTLTTAALESQKGHEGEHWRNVKQSMQDCRQTLNRLQVILKNLHKNETQFRRRVRKQVNLDLKGGEITMLKQQISSYRQAMQVSLQVITLSHMWSNGSHNVDMSSRLDTLMSQVQQVSRSLHNRKSRKHPATLDPDSVQINSHVMNNLSECVQSDHVLLSTASTISGSSSTMYEGSERGPEFGDGFCQPQRRLVHDWITEPTIHEDPIEHLSTPSNASSSAYAQGTNDAETALTTISEQEIRDRDIRFSTDLETSLIKGWQELASQKFNAGMYADAEEFLRRALTRSEARYGVAFTGRDQMMKKLAHVYREQGKLDEAERIWITLVEEGEHKNLSDIEYVLARSYFDKKAFDTALHYCHRVISKQATLGEGRWLFYRSVALLVKIYREKGDSIEAQGYMSLLPPGYQDCEEIEELCGMGHPQAAALVGFGYLNNILPITRYNDGKWASIKENIKASGVGVIGTGHGYAITHALAARGNQLAVELLLEKGASIEGRDENGRTMLHWAAEGGHERLVKFLLEKGADMDSKTTSGKKAVTLAYRKGYQVIVDLLKDSLSWNTMVYWPVKHRK